jgi:Ca-activated chloride channel family protein
VNKQDDQLDDELKKALDDLVIPPSRDAAKRRAIAMAREEFDAAHGAPGSEKNEKPSQGLAGWLRHIVRKNTDNGRVIMPFNQKLIYSGITAAAVGAVAVGISLQYQTDQLAPGKPPTTEIKRIEREQAEIALTDPARQIAAKSESLLKAKPAAKERVRADKRDQSDHMASYAGADVTEESIPTAAPSAVQGQAAAGAVMSKNLLSSLADSDALTGPYYREAGRDSFEEFEQNRVKLVSEEPVSTFSVDVDTASYSFVRRMLNSGVLPQGDAVRVEEMINYFDYDYPLPQSKAEPFQPTVAVSDAPWAEGRKVMHIGIKGYDITAADKPRSNLVFLLDVSGSMNSPDKLPLVKQSMELLLTTLDPDDTVAIAVYAGAAGTVLEPTPVKEKQKIREALRQLTAGGSTAGAQGIRLAYELAQAQFDENAINRVILATDGDFNVGITNQRELQSFIERKREEGTYLSVLGFGQGNYQDALMQTLAQNGNGVAAYIDTLSEAQKVLVHEATSTLFPIATDVKLQLEFNPATVAEYRLIGYETRHLNREDFNNDAVDAGDIGAGHTVTAIYEFTPVGSGARQIEESRYARGTRSGTSESNEYAFLKIRYKLPGEDNSKLITEPVTPQSEVEPGARGIGQETAFATAVAGFAQLLKGGKYTGDYDYDDVIEMAQKARGEDPFGYRTEFIQLVRKAKTADAMRAR